MKAIVLAAGEGRRLKPLTENTPKVMLPVGNRPILHYVVDALVKAGVRDIEMVVGYRAEKIRRYFGNGGRFGARIIYSVQEKRLGTAHALSKAGSDGEFIVLPGDNIISPECIRTVLNSGPGSILAKYSRDASKYGVVERKGDRLLRIVEKPRGMGEELIFTGIGHYGPEIFQYIESALEEGIYDMTSVLNRMGSLNVLVGDCLWKDAVYPWDLLDLNSWALRSTTRELSGKIEGARITGNVVVGEGSQISGGAYIRGPVTIGKNCYIGPNSVILGDTSIGNDVSIGAGSFVRNSVIMASSTIRHGSEIDRSIIGPGNEIGAGTHFLSSRWERVIEGDIIYGDSGSVTGNDCHVGPLAVIYPGLRVSSGSRIRAQSTIKEDIMKEDVV